MSIPTKKLSVNTKKKKRINNHVVVVGDYICNDFWDVLTNDSLWQVDTFLRWADDSIVPGRLCRRATMRVHIQACIEAVVVVALWMLLLMYMHSKQ